MVRPSNDSSPEAICAAGRVAARLARQVERALADADLSMPQYRLLALLSEGSAVASALAERLVVTRPSVTALVDGLVERGFVRRRSAPGDRRRVVHALTPKGRRALGAADRTIAGRLERVLSGLGARERGRALSAMGLWGEALDAQRARVVERAESEGRSGVR